MSRASGRDRASRSSLVMTRVSPIRLTEDHLKLIAWELGRFRQQFIRGSHSRRRTKSLAQLLDGMVHFPLAGFNRSSGGPHLFTGIGLRVQAEPA